MTAAKASSVEKGYISADDYDYIVKTLIDPDRATGLKVVVSSKEITDSDLEQQELDKFIEAADYKIARYADISLLVVALDTGEYLGSLYRTDDPIDLAIAIPSDVIALDAPVYVLRLHNGVVERLATTVRDGLACFASDLFSRFALGYQVEGLGGDDGLDADPDEDENKCKEICRKEREGCGVQGHSGRDRGCLRCESVAGAHGPGSRSGVHSSACEKSQKDVKVRKM